MSQQNRAEPVSNIENRLKKLRTAAGLSKADLASMAGLSRQAIYAIESDQYLPTTAVALRLAAALGCRVEDLFSLISNGQVIEADLIGTLPIAPRARVKLARVGKRTVVRPVAELGDLLNFTVSAEGLLLGPTRTGGRKTRNRVRVELLRERRLIEDTVVVAGCDPAIFLAGEYVRRRDPTASVVGWTMGSMAALEALKRQEVHMAGLHLVDGKSGESNLPYLRRHLREGQFVVVTFAGWEQGLMLQPENPKGLRGVEDLARRGVRIINREPGAGARVLLDRKLASLGIRSAEITGYDQAVSSHLEVGRLIAQKQVDAGIGVRAAAGLLGLEFIPLQEERYDLVVPQDYLDGHAGIQHFMDTLVTRSFRAEIQALGGYDTRETGKIRSLREE
jgi:molybdate-binding protein/DNA-binding XRE family transcriptional regulator